MSESQNIEYKINWRDEYLKWIAGFANASGGKIYIGLDDKGKAVGLNNAHKLMLWNEGRLPDDFTIETLLGKHPSRPFNKNVADIFFKVGFIEAWGRGIAKITSGFKNEGLKIPVFETTMGGIMVTIERPGKDKKSNKKNNVTENVTENVTNNVTNKRHDLILKLLIINNKITVDEIAERLNVTKRTIIRDIEKMKNNKLIERIGSPKAGHWRIIN